MLQFCLKQDDFGRKFCISAEACLDGKALPLPRACWCAGVLLLTQCCKKDTLPMLPGTQTFTQNSTFHYFLSAAENISESFATPKYPVTHPSAVCMVNLSRVLSPLALRLSQLLIPPTRLPECITINAGLLIKFGVWKDMIQNLHCNTFCNFFINFAPLKTRVRVKQLSSFQPKNYALNTSMEMFLCD